MLRFVSWQADLLVAREDVVLRWGVHIEMRHLLPSPERAGLGLAAACHTLNDMRGSIRHRSLRYGKTKLTSIGSLS